MWLRQSTASQEFKLGPYLDSTDGNTQETGLTIANTDVLLTKGGTTAEVSKNSGGLTHIAAGRYGGTFNATDTDTLGILEVDSHVTGALPTHRTYFVLPAPTYDALVTNGLNNLGGVPQTADNDLKLVIVDAVVDAIKVTTDKLTFTETNQVDSNMLTHTATIPSSYITSTGIAGNALDGKGNWNIDKTGYTGTATNMRGTDGANTTTPPTVDQILTTQMTESYAADGIAPTLAQALFIIHGNLQEFAYVGTKQTVNKLDGTTEAATYTLDNSSKPTSKTRAT